MKKILFSLFVLFFVFSCSDDNDPAPPNNNLPEVPTIGVTGGTVTSKDGIVKLVIPSGALISDKQIIIEKTTTTSPIVDEDAIALGDVYKLSPSGLTFKVPVEVIIDYSSFASEINTKTVLAAHWKTASNYEYVNIENAGNDKVSFEIRSFSSVQLNEFGQEVTAIPDKNFEQALIDFEIDTDRKINRRVLNSDIENVPELWMDEMQIDNLIGIQGFTNLEILVADHNNISKIDLIKNTKLWALALGENQFTSIDISKYQSLTLFSFYRNNISTIDVSKNLELVSLDLNGNNLTQIDVTKNINLSDLTIGDNTISKLDVSNNIKLHRLLIGESVFTSLDLSKNTGLITLSFSSDALTAIDLSNNLKLQSLHIRGNQISSLELVQHIDLEVLNCVNTIIKELNLSNNKKLVRVDFHLNPLLESLNIKNGYNYLIDTGNSNTAFSATQNHPNLCIQVDNATDANNGVAPYNTWVKDATARYSENCGN